MYVFAHRWPVDLILREFSFSPNTVVDWMRYCREICVVKVEGAMEGMIGGDNVIVEIDESVLVKRKYDRGRNLRTQWIVGGVERINGQYGRCFVEFVENRSAGTLDELIARHVDPQSRIMTDGWRGYLGLRGLGFMHDVVVHERNFVEPSDEEVHTQNIESFWSGMKRFLRRHGTNRAPHE